MCIIQTRTQIGARKNMNVIGTEVFIVEGAQDFAIGEMARVSSLGDVIGAVIFFLGQEHNAPVELVRELTFGPEKIPFLDIAPMIITDVPTPDWVYYTVDSSGTSSETSLAWVPIYDMEIELLTGERNGEILKASQYFWVKAEQLKRPFEEASIAIKEYRSMQKIKSLVDFDPDEKLNA